MKLFYTRKQVQGEIKKAVELKDEKIESLSKIINNEEFKYLEEMDKYKDLYDKLLETNRYHQKMLELKDNDLEQLSAKYRKICCSTGGLRKEINKLINQVEECQKKLSEKDLEIADLKSDRYLIKKVPAGKKTKTQEMKIYSASSTKKSEIIKKVTE